MKIISQFIMITATLIVITGNSWGTTKCVALNSSTSCQVDSKIGYVGWEATCGSFKLIGTGACSDVSGGTIAAQSDNIHVANADNVNKFCWCRMMSPAVSKWVFGYPFSSGAECAYSCGYRCGAYVNSSSPVRIALFKDLI